MNKLKTLHILLVDNDLNNLSSLEAMIQIPGIYPLKAGSGEEALSFINSHEPAIIFLDLQMKKTDGYALAEKIRDNKKSHRVPIVFISTLPVRRPFLFRGHENGSVDYMVKPLDKTVLTSKINFCIDLWKTTKSLEKKKTALHKALENIKVEMSEHRRTEAALRESRQQFKSLGENSPDIIYTLGLDGSFAYVNPAWKKILGHPRESVLGKYFVDFVEKDDVKQYRDFFRQIRDGKKTLRDVTGTLIHKKGSPRLFNLSGAPNVNGKGDVIGMVGLLKDITEQQKLQVQLLRAQKMEALGTLAGGIAHDFNNLLQAIQGYADLLLLSIEENSEAVEEVKEIKHASQRGAELTRQLLTFSRKAKSRLQAININSEIKHILKLLDRTIPKMIDIEPRLTEDVRIVNADPSQIEQIIMNLAVNARDAMPDGGKLTIKTEVVFLDNSFCNACPGLLPGDHVLLTATDTGCGMDSQVLEHLFEPFYTTKTNGKGTGLGLSIIYGIVKNHGGHIECSSRTGKGTEFKIYLPVLEQKLPAARSVNKKEIAASKGNETVMFVDDDSQVRHSGEQLLTRYGYKMLTASSGENALELYRQKHEEIDLIILDLIMPGMGGINCLEEILKINPREKIIVTTGHECSKSEKEGPLSKITHFIHKPYESHDLLQTARFILDRS